MRKITSLTNTDAADADYPYGRIRNNTGSGNGTPVNEALLGDMAQFFAKLMAEGSVTANDLPDNYYSGFQLYQALQGVLAGEDWNITTLFTSVTDGLYYRKDKGGWVHVKGVLNLNTARTLPTGYRPGTAINCNSGLWVSNSGSVNGISTVAFATNGNITCADLGIGAGSPAYVSVDFSFKAA